MNVSRQFATDVAKGQREALELGRKLAAEPTDFGQYATPPSSKRPLLPRAAPSPSPRSLPSHQPVTCRRRRRRGHRRRLVQANRETAEAAVQAARNWTAANPVADMMRKGVENMTAATNGATGKKKAEKASPRPVCGASTQAGPWARLVLFHESRAAG